MTFKLFFRWMAAARRHLFAAETSLGERKASRRQLARTDERFNAPAHPVRGPYLGLLVGLDVPR